MLAKYKTVEENLKDVIKFEINNEKHLNYKEWDDINFWNFLSVNYGNMNTFFTLLDIEQGAEYGWEKFVETLGLNFWEDRKWCYQYHNGQGPTKTALSKLLNKKIQDENLKLGYVIEILQEMGRHDILLQTDWKLLVDNYHKFWNSKDLPSKENIFGDTRTHNFELSAQSEVLSTCLPNLRQSSICYKNLNDSQLRSNKKFKKSTKPCILFCYAHDAENYAKQVAESLRSAEDEKKKIKIVLISDERVKKALAIDYNNTLHKWFNQVHYIVPILSPEYLLQIQNNTAENLSEEALYNRFIYRLLMDQFVAFGSRNLRCRPLCPEQYKNEIISKSSVKDNGLFTVTWHCGTPKQIEQFRVVLLDTPLV